MLDRAGDTDGDVEFGGHDLAGLADLIVVGHIARVHRSARCADAGAELVSQWGDDLFESLCILQRAATRYDHLGAGQFRTLAFRDFGTDEAGRASIARAGYGFNRAAATFRRGLFKRGAAYGDDQLRIGAFDRCNRVAGIDRAGEGLLAFNRQDV